LGGGGEGYVVGVVYCPVSLVMLVVTEEGDEEMDCIEGVFGVSRECEGV
jgi:hypothetical protein